MRYFVTQVYNVDTDLRLAIEGIQHYYSYLRGIG
jgi:hypothetical protein